MNAAVKKERNVTLEERVGVIETRVAVIETDVAHLKADVREIRQEVRSVAESLAEFRVEVAKEFGLIRAELQKNKLWTLMIAFGAVIVPTVSALAHALKWF